MDEVRALEFFPLREAVFLFAKFNAPHEERHIPGQGPHGLQAFRVLGRLAGLPPVNAVPVLAGGHGHAGDSEELVQFVEGGGEPSTSRGHNGGAYLHGLVEGRTVEEPRQKGHQRGIGGGIVDGTAHHQAVSGLKLRRDLVDGVVKDAPAFLRALAAGDATPDWLVSDLNRLGLDAFSFENTLHLPQGQGGVAVGTGTAVNHQNFHMKTSMDSGLRTQ